MTDSLHIEPGSDDAARQAADAAAIQAVDDKEAALKGEQQEQQQEQPERPEWLPEKFKSPEDLAKAYEELQKKLGGGEQKPTEKEEPKGADQEEGGKSFDWDKFAEAAATGEISDELKAAAKEAGIPDSVLDGYAQGIQAQVQLVRQQMFDAVGGEEQFKAVSEWAQANADEATLKAYNEALDKGDMDESIKIMQSLREQYVEANGEEGTREKGLPSGGNTGYESWAQVQKDMADPQYHKDPAFRARVEAKLKNSKL